MILTAFLRTGAAEAVDQVAVVGDTSYDMLSAVRAGAGLVAGVLTGARDADALRSAGATQVLDGVGQLTTLDCLCQTRSTMSAMESTTFVGR